MNNFLKNKKFKEQARLIHKDEFDYSLVQYIRRKSKIKIICKKHGVFEQTPDNHLAGNGCNKCYLEIKKYKQRDTKNIFIEKAKLKHKNKYDYSYVEYDGSKVKVLIKCIQHNYFFNQRPNDHLIKGTGCLKCLNKIKDLESFIEKANIIHNKFYDYSLVKYSSVKEKVSIICPKHDMFFQRVNNHLNGQGCPVCGHKNLSEFKLFFKMKNSFPNENIISQGKPIWLKGNTNSQSLDIYFPDYNIAIEYQGIQHFKQVNYFGGIKGFDYLKQLDTRKYKLCLENNCRLFYFTYIKNDIPKNYLDEIINNENKLIKEITLIINENKKSIS